MQHVKYDSKRVEFTIEALTGKLENGINHMFLNNSMKGSAEIFHSYCKWISDYKKVEELGDLILSTVFDYDFYSDTRKTIFNTENVLLAVDTLSAILHKYINDALKNVSSSYLCGEVKFSDAFDSIFSKNMHMYEFISSHVVNTCILHRSYVSDKSRNSVSQAHAVILDQIKGEWQ